MKETRADAMEFLGCLWRRLNKDDVLFLASGMSFNILLCLLPILMLLIYLMGIGFQSAETIQDVDHLLEVVFPNQPYALAIRKNISLILAEIVAQRKSFGLLSAALLAGASVSLFSSMRSVLHRVFEIRENRHFVISYFFDLALVLGSTLLILLIFCLNGIYHFMRKWEKLGTGDLPRRVHEILGIASDLASPGFMVLLCYLLYRHVPVQRIRARIALVSSMVTVLIWEVSGSFFAWYLGMAGSFNKTYGAYAFLIVLMVWIYYSSLIFILGAEVGQVLRERFHGGDRRGPAPVSR